MCFLAVFIPRLMCKKLFMIVFIDSPKIYALVIWGRNHVFIPKIGTAEAFYENCVYLELDGV